MYRSPSVNKPSSQIYYTPQQEEEKFGGEEGWLEWLGGILDKPARPLRQIGSEVRSWFGGPEHDFKASELLAPLPYSDALGLTNPENMATGRDVLGLHDKDDWLQGAAGFATEMALDPLNIITFGGVGALTKGGKVLNKMGALDDVVEAAAIKAGRSYETGLLPKFTKMDSTVGEGIEAYTDSLRKKMGADADPLIKSFNDNFINTAQAEGLIDTGLIQGNKKQSQLQALLDQNIGDAFGRQSANPVPRIFGRSMWGDSIGSFGTNEMTKGIAKAAGQLKHTVAMTPGINHLRVLFNPELQGMLDPKAQAFARNSWRGAREADRLVRLRSENVLRNMEAMPERFTVGHDLGGGRKLTQEEVSRNHIALTRFMEDETYNLPTDLKAVGDSLLDLKKDMKQMYLRAREAGVEVQMLDDLEIGDNYVHRMLFQGFGDGSPTQFKPKATALTEHQSQEARVLFRDIPHGIAGIQELSMDPFLSGIAHKHGGYNLQGTGRETLDQLTNVWEDTAYGGSRPWESKSFLRKYIRKAIAIGSGRKEGVKLSYGGKEPLALEINGIADIELRKAVDIDKNGRRVTRPTTQAEKDRHLDQVIEFMGKLDSRHAREGMPAFVANPVESYMAYAEKMHRVVATHEQIGMSLAESAVSKLDPRSVQQKHISLKAALEQLGMTREESVLLPSGTRRELEEQFGATTFTRKVPGVAMARKIIEANPETLRHVSGGGRLTDEQIVRYLNDHGSKHMIYVPEEMVSSARMLLEAQQNPGKVNGFSEFISVLDKLQNAWRAGVTILFPSFHTRNFLGGQFNNWITHSWSARSLVDAHNTMLGNAVAGAGRVNWDLSIFPDSLRRTIEADIAKAGGMTDEIGTRIGLAHIFSNRLWVPDMQSPQMEVILNQKHADVVGELVKMSDKPVKGTEASAEYIKGLFSKSANGQYDMTLLDIVGMANPVFPFSPGSMVGKGAFGDSHRSALHAAGHKAASKIEGYNRLAPFWKLVKEEGYSPKAAVDLVKKSQVDYSNLSDFEKNVMRRSFSFYTFTRHMVPFVLEKMVTEPSGRMMQTMRGIGRLKRDDEFQPWAPDYIREGAGVPLLDEVNEDGTREMKYIHSVGTPFEDVMNLIPTSFSPGDLARNLAVRANPLAQVAAEMAFGQDLFYGRDPRQLSRGKTVIGKDADLQVRDKNHWLNHPVFGLVPGHARALKKEDVFDQEMDEAGRKKWGGWYPKIIDNKPLEHLMMLLPMGQRTIYDADKQKRQTMNKKVLDMVNITPGFYQFNIPQPEAGVTLDSLSPGSDQYNLLEMLKYNNKIRSDARTR